MTPRPRGNPQGRIRGEAVREVLLRLLGKRGSAELALLMETTGLSRPSVLCHLWVMKAQAKIAGYSTNAGKVQTWQSND